MSESEVAYSRLHHNQSHAGYCVVILKRHAVELHELDEGEYEAFWRDVRRLSMAVADLFSPAKLDTLVMGQLCPHVHFHIYPSTRVTIRTLSPTSRRVRYSYPTTTSQIGLGNCAACLLSDQDLSIANRRVSHKVQHRLRLNVPPIVG